MSKKFKITVNYQEFSTILAALRMFQESEIEARLEMPHFDDVEPLDDDEIDELCERINGE